MKLFERKLRKRIETKIKLYSEDIASLEAKIISDGVKQTLNPSEYAKRSVVISDLKHDLNLLESLLA